MRRFAAVSPGFAVDRPVDRFADLLTETHRVVHSDFDHEHSIQTSDSPAQVCLEDQ